MNHVRRESVPTKTDGGEVRSYYLFDDFEMIVTELPAGHEQPWHSHKSVKETHYVLLGTIEVLEDGDNAATAHVGDVVILGPGRKHTMRNPSEKDAYVLTLKTIATDQNYRQVFSSDKITG